ncbi:hypothetical protein SASPL_141240 [Salvia splendens]|uniref:Oxidation resistance protein 1 n=1 Tax=Salvia splendens TaxID=180675 RepID=A0A8X8WRW0_SALSN|nr:hypothetical protein SASPL_141240 [Salvia splendens]
MVYKASGVGEPRTYTRSKKRKESSTSSSSCLRVSKKKEPIIPRKGKGKRKRLALVDEESEEEEFEDSVSGDQEDEAMEDEDEMDADDSDDDELEDYVVGDRKGATFGGLVEAPLRPTNKRYQGTIDSFVFSNISGNPLIFRPTGKNRYFTLCSTNYLAMGGGGHFALYLDGDLLSGSSSSSETYDNPCLALSEEFDIKEVELWGFVYASKYEEMVALSRIETPGICHL